MEEKGLGVGDRETVGEIVPNFGTTTRLGALANRNPTVAQPANLYQRRAHLFKSVQSL